METYSLIDGDGVEEGSLGINGAGVAVAGPGPYLFFESIIILARFAVI
jgi:hypothetical protein